MTDRRADVPFAELHAKSAFSFLRATATPEALVARAVELGLRGLALVDEGSLSGAVRFIRAAQAAQLPALLGVEFEMADPAVPDIDGILSAHLQFDGVLPASGDQLTLLGARSPRVDRLAWSTAAIAIRYGADRVLHAEVVDPDDARAERRTRMRRAHPEIAE